MIRRLFGSYSLTAGGLLLGIGLLAGQLNAATAGAQIVLCRDDPMVTLSDGTTLTVATDIGDTPADVRGITYTLQIPKGVSVTSIKHVGILPASLEHVLVSSDQNPGEYRSAVNVDTGIHDVAVSDILTVGLLSNTGTGHSHNDVTARVRLGGNN